MIRPYVAFVDMLAGWHLIYLADPERARTPDPRRSDIWVAPIDRQPSFGATHRSDTVVWNEVADPSLQSGARQPLADAELARTPDPRRSDIWVAPIGRQEVPVACPHVGEWPRCEETDR